VQLTTPGGQQLSKEDTSELKEFMKRFWDAFNKFHENSLMEKDVFSLWFNITFDLRNHPEPNPIDYRRFLRPEDLRFNLNSRSKTPDLICGFFGNIYNEKEEDYKLHDEMKVLKRGGHNMIYDCWRIFNYENHLYRVHTRIFSYGIYNCLELEIYPNTKWPTLNSLLYNILNIPLFGTYINNYYIISTDCYTGYNL
ncbi:hypothetical protein ACJX0J_016069, partial [Zea mays]